MKMARPTAYIWPGTEMVKKPQKCKCAVIAVSFRKKAHQLQFCLCHEAHALSHHLFEKDETVLCSGKERTVWVYTLLSLTHNACRHGHFVDLPYVCECRTASLTETDVCCMHSM